MARRCAWTRSRATRLRKRPRRPTNGSRRCWAEKGTKRAKVSVAGYSTIMRAVLIVTVMVALIGSAAAESVFSRREASLRKQPRESAKAVQKVPKGAELVVISKKG